MASPSIMEVLSAKGLQKMDYSLQRGRKRHRRHTLSMEMILRKSASETLKEYTKHSSILGVTKICDPCRKWKERLVWIIIFGVMLVSLYNALKDTWDATISKPLILTPEIATEPTFESDFPAIAFCNVNRVSKTVVEDLVERAMIKHNHTSLNYRSNLINFFKESGRLLDLTYNESTEVVYADILRKLNLNNKLVLDITKGIAPDCNKMLLHCFWNAEKVNCSELFRMRRTGHGYCCAFNYVLDYDNNGLPYRIVKPMRQKVSGFYYGLTVVLDPLVKDYAYPIRATEGFDVFIFDPTHFADPTTGRVVHRMAVPNKIEYMEMTSVKQIAAAEIRNYPLRMRKCLFRDDLYKTYRGLYSYSTCIINCRIEAMLSLCQCMPYYYPAGKTIRGRMCYIDDLKCLQKYKDKFFSIYPPNAETQITGDTEDALHCPECFPDCEQTRYFVEPFKLSLEENFKRSMSTFRAIANENSSDKCIVSIYYVNSVNKVDRLDTVNTWYQILSNIGGYGSMLIGISMCSFIELIFYFCVRYVQLVCRNFKKYH